MKPTPVWAKYANFNLRFKGKRFGSLLDGSTGRPELKLLLAYELFRQSETPNIWSLIFNDGFPSLKWTAREVKHWNMDVLLLFFSWACLNQSCSSCVSSLVGRQAGFDVAPRRQLVDSCPYTTIKNIIQCLNLVNSEAFCFQVCLIPCSVPVGFVLMCS